MKKGGRFQNVYEKCTGGDCADGLFCCPSGMCMDSDTGSTTGPNCLRAQGHLDTCRLARNGQCNYHYPSPEDPSCRVGSDCTDCGKEPAEMHDALRGVRGRGRAGLWPHEEEGDAGRKG